MKIPYMRGILGQYVFTLPEKNAVIVRLGHKRSDTYTADQHYPDDINTWLTPRWTYFNKNLFIKRSKNKRT